MRTPTAWPFTIVLSLVLLALSPSTARSHNTSPATQGSEELLLRLDRELEQRETYNRAYARTLDSLAELVDDETRPHAERLALRLRLADRYRQFDVLEATLHYEAGAKWAEHHGNDTLATLFHLRHATYMPLQGYVTVATREIGSLDTAKMSLWMKAQYYDAKRQLYRYAEDAYEDFPDGSRRFHEMSDQAQGRLIDLLDESSPLYALNLGEWNMRHGRQAEAKRQLLELVAKIPDDGNLYARAASMLAQIADTENDTDDYRKWLAASALADTRSATLEVSSLQLLGQLLFHDGDVERAHRYLTFALQNAVDAHATLRILQSSKMLPLIEQAHNAETRASDRRVAVAVAVLVVLVLALGALLYVLFRKVGKLHALSSKLAEANRVKEYYLTQFLTMSSFYMDKLSTFARIVQRKITAGASADLLKSIGSSKFIDEQSRDFYRVFDEAFLRIYPDFVDRVNALLRPDSRLEAPEAGLSPELRLLALMRLGIDESARLAQMLNYSINTVYAYRNRLKNRAVSRDTFEADIQAIDKS